MKTENKYEGIAVVEMHLNDGFTKVLLETTRNISLADGGICIDIPTNKIPYNFRHINSRFHLEIKIDDDILIKKLKNENCE